MLLFYDTETTGLLNFKEDYRHVSQPSLVQLAAVLTEDDGTERASMSVILDPGRPIPTEASDVHGITDEVIERCSMPPKTGLQTFTWLLQRADTIVAHNQDFDQKVISTALHRVDMGGTVARIENVMARVCTMKPATNVVKVLHKSPRHSEDYKWPKLEECIRHFFNEDLKGAHDALVDVRACIRVYFELKKLGAIQ